MTFAPVNRISAERTVVQEFKRERSRDFPPESVREPPVQFCLHLDLNVFMSFFAQGYEGRGRPYNFRIAHRHIEFPVEASHPPRTCQRHVRAEHFAEQNVLGHTTQMSLQNFFLCPCSPKTLQKHFAFHRGTSRFKLLAMDTNKWPPHLCGAHQT